MSILQDMIHHVGGERVEVRNIIPMGAGPESYQPKPQDVRATAAAQIVFYNGTGLEDWLKGLFDAAGRPGQRRVGLSDGLPAIDKSSEFSAGNPHFWLDPQYGITYVERIRDELRAADKDGAATYSANAQAYIAELRALDAKLAEQAIRIPLQQRKLVTNHDAFPYFAARYGFQIVGNILPNADSQLSAARIKQLADLIKVQHVRAIFAESQFRPEITRQIAEDAGVKIIATLYTDSLGKDAPTYTAMLQYDMNQIVSALLSSS
jgi:zinc/manganese transport system substrate-binding protein/manganese/iron transport system substrate-binding protein